MKRGLVILMLAVALVQCSDSRQAIYSDSQSFENDTWKRFTKLHFDIPVEKTDKTYDLFFNFVYSDDFQHDQIPVHAILNSPSGEERIYTFHIQVRDTTGQDMGKKSEDSKYYHLEAPLWQEVSFPEKGEVALSFEQIIPKFSTTGIHKAGVKVYYSEE